MSKPVDFVLAAERDAKTIVELRQKIWATTYRGIYPDQMIDEFDSAWHIEKELQRIRHPDYREYLVVRDGRQIGYLITRKKDEVALQSLYVLKEHQRQGVGTAAFAFVQRYCTENGSASFVCQCVPENWNARRFYERMGGKIIGEDMENEERWQNSVTYRFDVGQ